ncbi:zinc finger MYM-type protein 6-like [Rhopalosiphum padi]|uniref:zinc finger MYM-type protein 6-like n=1 Tax=Rhopalosiphum padi TaxID=40932 RepID=UPI00298DB81B|nr:zinc finger MYM-type protein 6-like [Rhopalosiphum padi]
MSKQTSLSNFFKQPSTSNSSSAIVNGPDSDVSENELRPPLKKVKLTTKILNYNENYVEYGFTYLRENNIDLPQSAMHIAKSKKAYTIGEKLLKPCMIDIFTELFGSEYATKINSIPMSNDTISRRINIMAVDIEYQLIQKINKSIFYGIQIDESTDINNEAILLIYIRYVDTDLNDINEEFLCCLNLPTFCTSEEIFKAILMYFDKNDLSISKCIGICTDGAAAMTGKFNGLVARIKQIAHKDIISTHCFIHREQLATKDMVMPKVKSFCSTRLRGFVKEFGEALSD